MKIIDLLNKIANGEEVPKNIKFMSSIWKYCKDGTTQDYINNYDKCLMEFIAINKDGLNYEVEIIEEPKKIEKLNTNIINANRYDYDKSKKMTISNIAVDILSISKVVNELIDEVNNLKEK